MECSPYPNNNQLEAHLLKLPEEVLYGYIFPYLQLNEVLRLRLVCRPIKEFANGFIRTNFKSLEREINETDATFGDFLRRKLPTNAIYIKNSGPEIYEDPDVAQFLEVHGKEITHLRVAHFTALAPHAERHFFSSLINLEHLELEFMDVSQRQSEKISWKKKKKAFPQNFKNLKTLKLNEIDGDNHLDPTYAWDIIPFCTKLEYLKHPFYTYSRMLPIRFRSLFECVMKLIKERHRRFPNQPNLQFYDLEHHETYNGHYSMIYFKLLELCTEHGVKLLNVHADMHEQLNHNDIWPGYTSAPEKFTVPIASLNNIHSYNFVGELPNLEKLVIKSTAQCSFAEWYFFYDREEPEWPKLKILDITIDSESLDWDDDIPEKSTDDLLEFLFYYKGRDDLRELAIRYGEPDYEDDDLPIPKVLEVVMSCDEITKLTLTNWLGTNKAVSVFWNLFLLEEVTLENCKMLADVAFVGKRVEEPAFLTLRKLRKFTLKGLDVMPKVTDKIFKLVFRHLKIKEFHLQSAKPITSITINGIQSLLTGDFNKCVEKFPFTGWSLDGISEDGFGHLKSQFRASHMMQ